nr:uncharacterized protein LOC116149417 [Camelus dromedarius]
MNLEWAYSVTLKPRREGAGSQDAHHLRLPGAGPGRPFPPRRPRPGWRPGRVTAPAAPRGRPEPGKQTPPRTPSTASSSGSAKQDAQPRDPRGPAPRRPGPRRTEPSAPKRLRPRQRLPVPEPRSPENPPPSSSRLKNEEPRNPDSRLLPAKSPGTHARPGRPPPDPAPPPGPARPPRRAAPRRAASAGARLPPARDRSSAEARSGVLTWAASEGERTEEPWGRRAAAERGGPGLRLPRPPRLREQELREENPPRRAQPGHRASAIFLFLPPLQGKQVSQLASGEAVLFLGKSSLYLLPPFFCWEQWIKTRCEVVVTV